MTTPAGWLWSTTTGTSATYAANALNQYASVSGVTFTYDKNGNLTGDGTWTYAYDTENRLTTASKTGVSVTYAYDPRGRRKAKTVATTTAGVTTTTKTLYLSAGDQEITEYAQTATSLMLNSRYVFGPGLDEPLAIVSGDKTAKYFFHADPLGSTIAVTNAASLTIYRNKYTAYGLGASSNVLSLQFAGRRYDGETGLYYNRARMYAPALGRFLQPDPIKTDGGINIYAYVKNDPLNATDPKGEWTLQIGIAGSWVTGLLGFPGGVGIAVDGNFNFARYEYLGVGVNAGASVDAGFSIQVSNASSVYDLSGWFNNGSVHGGVGIGGSFDYFNGGDIQGVGITFGAAAGASAFAGRTYTWINGSGGGDGDSSSGYGSATK